MLPDFSQGQALNKEVTVQQALQFGLPAEEIALQDLIASRLLTQSSASTAGSVVDDLASDLVAEKNPRSAALEDILGDFGW